MTLDEFVLKFVIDPTGVQSGGKQVDEAVEKSRKGAVKAGKDIEESTTKAADGFRNLAREAVGFFAVIVGAVGLTDFVRNVVSLDAATGRLANNLGLSTEALSAWEGAVRQNGGTTADAVQSIQALVNAYQQITVFGDPSKGQLFNALGISLRDLQDPSNTLLKLADRFHNMPAPRAMALGTALGLSPSMIVTLEQGRKAVLAYLEAETKAGLIHEKDAIAAQRLQAQLEPLMSTWRNFGRALVTDVLPAATAFTQWVTAISQDPSMQRLVTDLGAMGQAFSTLAKSIHLNDGVVAVFKAWNAVVDTLVRNLTAAARITDDIAHGRSIDRINRDAAYGAGPLLDAIGPRPAPSLASGARGAAGSSGAPGGLFSALESRFGLPGGLLDKIWWQESRRGRNRGPSSAGALGDFQFMPATARGLGIDPNDFGQSAMGAAHLLSDLARHYGGDWIKAIAAYNWRPAALDADIRKHGADWERFAPHETRAYLASLRSSARRDISGGGRQTSVTIGTLNVNAPQAKDAYGVAHGMKGAIAAQADFGLYP